MLERCFVGSRGRLPTGQGVVVSIFPQPAGRRQALISAAGRVILLFCTIIDVVRFDETLFTSIIA